MDKMKKEEKIEPPDGGYGWVIMMSIVIINVSLLTLVQCFGIIFHDEFKEMGITSAETSFLLHLHTALYCSFGFFSSPLLKILSYRTVAYVGITLMCLGIFLTSFANSYAFLIFSVSVLIGVGQGIMVSATYLATYTYFKKRLTIAISISVTGSSLSSIVMPKLCDILLANVGRKYTVLILFGISLSAVLVCALLRPLRKPNIDDSKVLEVLSEDVVEVGVELNKASEELKELKNPDFDKLLPVDKVYHETTIPVKKVTLWTKLNKMFDLQLLKNVPFVLIMFGLSISFASELNIIVMIQFILRELSNFTRAEVATVAAIQSIADIVGRTAIPFVAHMFQAPPKFMYFSALLFATAGRAIITIWSESHCAIYTASTIIGLTKGTRAVFQSVIMPIYVPLEKIPTANGLTMLLTGALSLIIGPILGLIHDHTNSYVYSLHAGSILSCSCVLIWILEILYTRQMTKNQTKGQNK